MQAPAAPSQETGGNRLDLAAWQSVQRKARRLVARPPFCPWEREDVEQELAIRLWRALLTYDPALGSRRAFVSTILHRAAATLARARRSHRSGRRLARWSLHLLCEGEGEESLAGDVASEMVLSSAVSEEDHLELVHDVAAVVEHLPQRLKRIAQQLKHFSASEIAVREGIARSTVYLRIRELRARFAEAGFSEILGICRTLQAPTAKEVYRGTLKCKT
jgi:RNA polymerase sigma factor (sigma-70 family)